MVATAEQKSQEEVAKSVKRISELLAMHGANPAQVKAQKKEDKELRNQEKDLLNKWVDVIDQQKKDLEKRTVKVSSMTSFIGLEAKKYFAETERNMVTWGGLAKSIGSGVKDWFNAAMKQNTMLGATLRLGATLWKGVNDHIIGAIKNVFGKIGSQVREVMGELAEVFDVIAGVFKSAFNFIKDSFLGFFARVPPQDRLRNRLLQRMLDFMRRREKRDFLEMGRGTGGGDKGFWLIVAMIAAGLIGGFIRKFLLPFELLIKVSKLGVFTAKFWAWIKGFSFVGKLLAPIIGVGGMMDKVVVWAGKFAVWFPKFSQGLGFLFKALKFGFKFIGWPIQIIFSVIDFIQGFRKTEGNIAQKIIGGLKNVVKGFIELPVRLIGWVIEKVLGLFGVKVEGVADKIMKVIDTVLKLGMGWLKPIIGFFEGFFSTEGNIFKKLIGGVKGFFDGLKSMFMTIAGLLPESMQKNIIKFFTAFEAFFEMLIDKFKGLLEWFGIEFNTPESGTTTTMAPVKGDLMQVTQAEAAKYDAERDAYNAGVTGAIETQTKKTIEAQKRLAKQQGDAMAVAITGGGAGGTAPGSPDTQIPDELNAPGMFGNGSLF